MVDKLNGMGGRLTRMISANMYDDTDKIIDFDGTGPGTKNLFRIYGSVSVQKITGVVDTALSDNIGNGYLDFVDDSSEIKVTASPGTSFDSLPENTYIHRIDDCSTKIKIEDSSVIHLYEDLTRFDTSPKFEVIAKSNCPSYIRFCYSGIGTSGKIRWRILWMPLTKYSRIEVAG